MLLLLLLLCLPLVLLLLLVLPPVFVYSAAGKARFMQCKCGLGGWQRRIWARSAYTLQ